jgi:hypothetical protein
MYYGVSCSIIPIANNVIAVSVVMINIFEIALILTKTAILLINDIGIIMHMAKAI